MGFNLGAGLSLLGNNLAQSAAVALLEQQKSELEAQRMELADRLASERESRGRQEEADIQSGKYSSTGKVDKDGNLILINPRGETTTGPAIGEDPGVKEEREIQRKAGESDAAYRNRMATVAEKNQASEERYRDTLGGAATTRADAATTRADADAAGKLTATQKNAKYYVDIGAAPDEATAVKMLKTGVNDATTYQRLVQSEKKAILSSPLNYSMSDADVEKLAQRNVNARATAAQVEPSGMAPTASPSPKSAGTADSSGPIIPPRPSSLPAGSAYSASRRQWRDPAGDLYDASGNPL